MRYISQPHSPRESVEDYTLRQRRGESSQVHGDQTGRDGGTKKVKEENETLDDLQQNEDERGCFQPLWKMDTEAAERTPSRTASVLRRLDERRTDGDENRICEPPSPGLAALPFIFKP